MTGPDNKLAIVFFFIFVSLTLAITYWAARRTNTTDQFFAADRAHGFADRPALGVVEPPANSGRCVSSRL